MAGLTSMMDIGREMEKKTREEAIEELSLMLLYLTRFSDDNEYCRYMEMAWKSYDFDALNQLARKEFIFQPRSSDEINLRDEFYKDPTLHDPSGRNTMLLGVDVLPEYRKQGIAREMVYSFLRRENERNRKFIILTCLADKVKMYKKFGFRDYGEANSSWGGKKWHEMVYVLN